MRNIGLLALAALIFVAPATAALGDMNVATFLAKADKLEKRGVAALLSSDLQKLKREVEASAEAYTARIKADEAAGRAPHSCPPKGKKSLSSDQFLTHLRSYPAARRSSTTIKVAFADLMKKRFPC